MFIYSIWNDICQEIVQYNTIKVEEILKQPKNSTWIAVKHDVETNVSKALELARIEAKYGINATYYVQSYLLDENYELLQIIQSLGHEVTYHYDVLDANAGNMEKAIVDFDKNIAKFKQYGFNVKTVCPHGNPVMIRNGWNSNKDFFRNEKVQTLYPHILDIVIQLPKKIDYLYISDAGYGFKKIGNIRDNDLKNIGDIEISDYRELLKSFSENKRIILSTHPHRWEKNIMTFIMRVYLFKFLRIVARVLSKLPILKNIISKYYYLAKKI